MLLFNILSIGLLYGFWLITQYSLQHDTNNNNIIIDRVHNFVLFDAIHKYLVNNKNVARWSIIITSLMIDLNLVYFVYDFICNKNIKPIILLVGGVVLRQFCQHINRLPSPDNIIWYETNFPSLIMNYNVTDDFFFSGHTLVSLIFGIELLQIENIYVQGYAIFYMMVEILFVLCSRAHYFMDIYGAIGTYFMMLYFYDKYLLV